MELGTLLLILSTLLLVAASEDHIAITLLNTNREREVFTAKELCSSRIGAGNTYTSISIRNIHINRTFSFPLSRLQESFTSQNLPQPPAGKSAQKKKVCIYFVSTSEAQGVVNLCHLEVLLYMDSLQIRLQCKNNLVHAEILPSHQEKHRLYKRLVKDDQFYNRELKVLALPQRHLELAIAADQTFLETNVNQETATERLLTIAAYVASIYHQLNINVVLVGIDVWTRNPINITHEDSNAVLAEFQGYRKTDLNHNIPSDYSQLILGQALSDGKLGKATPYSICSYDKGAGIATDNAASEWIVSATTVAHELGHALGLTHDNEDQDDICVCDTGSIISDICIMHSQSSGIQPTHFSNCSTKQYRHNAFVRNLDWCLRNEPEVVHGTSYCGNFIVDHGEECDCGLPADCKSKCCDPDTCRLVQGAICSSGACCDVGSCEPLLASTVCRDEVGECDLPEYCDGDSGVCPDDFFKADGISCQEGEGHCYFGECPSRNKQCRLIWGQSADSSVDQCYDHWNRRDAYFGNCGYQRETNGSIQFQPCNEVNTKCGLLQCQNSSSLHMALLAWSTHKHIYYTPEGDQHQCDTVVFDTVSDEPGLVPDGSKCGSSKYCVSQQCVEIEPLPEHCNCSDKGVCNNRLHCHCISGYDPESNCFNEGRGGSLDSGPMRTATVYDGSNLPTSDNTLTIVLCVVFLLVLPGLVIAAIVWKRRTIAAHCRAAGKSSSDKYAANEA